jgi:hypothetical protein
MDPKDAELTPEEQKEVMAMLSRAPGAERRPIEPPSPSEERKTRMVGRPEVGLSPAAESLLARQAEERVAQRPSDNFTMLQPLQTFAFILIGIGGGYLGWKMFQWFRAPPAPEQIGRSAMTTAEALRVLGEAPSGLAG